MEICPVCQCRGYLYKEKIRTYKQKQKRRVENKKHKDYESAKRVRHGYWYFVHNMQINIGKWKTRRCYLGLRKSPFSKSVLRRL